MLCNFSNKQLIIERLSLDFSCLDFHDVNPSPYIGEVLDKCEYAQLRSIPQKQGSYCTHVSNLSMIHVNIRSLPKNIDKLELLINQLPTKPNIILVSETWLDDSLAQSYCLPGFRLETSSPTVHRGKGSAIYIQNAIPYKRRHEIGRAHV